jgi:putative spermidine/putrescine transport system permease protein
MAGAMTVREVEGSGRWWRDGARSSNWWLVLPAVLLMLVAYCVPLIRVLWISFTEPRFGFHNYGLLFTNLAVGRVLLTTLRVSLTTTVVSVVIAYLIAYAITHASATHRRTMLMFVLMPFWVSVLVRAFAWVTLLGREGVINKVLVGSGVVSEPLNMMYNQFGVNVGMVHYMVPVATLTLYANMAGIDRRLVSAARGLGASPGQAFWRVFLPLSLPGVAAAAALVFVFSTGFFVTPALLGGGKTLMAAQFITVLVSETLQWGLATMLASILLLAIFALLAALSMIFDLRRVFAAG